MVSTKLFRFALGILSLSLVLMMYALFTSTVDGGVVLGRLSVTVAVVLAVFMFALAGAVSIAFKPSLFPGSLSTVLSGIQDIAAGLAAVVFPLCFLLVWFLFPAPILQRSSFFAGALLFTLVPALFSYAFFKPAKRKAALSGTAVMVFSFVVAVGLAEVVLGKIMPRSIFNPRFGLIPYRNISLEVNLPGITPGGVLSTYRWGLRGEAPPEHWSEYLTIVTVGGSTTANYYLDDDLTWSHIMQNCLREQIQDTWVGNGGIPRHSSDMHRLFVGEVLSRIKPDIALFLVGVNDMGPFLRGGSLYVERLPDSGPRQALFAHSMVLQLLYKAKKVYIDGVPVITESVDPYYHEVLLTEPEAVLPDDLHDLLDDPMYYRNRIRRLIQECRSLGITPVFMTQPLLFQDNEHWREVQEATQWLDGCEQPLSAAGFALMLETLNSDLLEVCVQEGVAVLDLASEIPHRQEFFYDCMHMTESGASLVGGKASDFILQMVENGEINWQED